MRKKAQIQSYIIVFLILFAIACIIIFIIALKNKENEREQEIVWNLSSEPPKHILSMIFRDYSTDTRIDVSYYLYDNETGERVSEGYVFADAVTQYANATENKTYSLVAFENNDIQPDYYYKTQDCFVGSSDTICTIQLLKEGNPVMEFMEIDSETLKVVIYNDYGTVENPMICFGYSVMFSDFDVESHEKVAVPHDLLKYYDFCVYENTIGLGEPRFLTIKKSGWGQLSILVRDFCHGYTNETCGIEDRVISGYVKL